MGSRAVGRGASSTSLSLTPLLLCLPLILPHHRRPRRPPDHPQYDRYEQPTDMRPLLPLLLLLLLSHITNTALKRNPHRSRHVPPERAHEAE